MSIYLKALLIIALFATEVGSASYGDPKIDAIYFEIQDGCKSEKTKQSCLQTIEKIRTKKEYQDTDSKVIIAQSLIPPSSGYPELLNISVSILDELIAEHSTNMDLKGLRASILYKRHPIEGIAQAFKDDAYGMLSLSLSRYYTENTIKRDIKLFAAKEVYRRLAQDEQSIVVLSALRIATKQLRAFGTEGELSEFLVETRKSIPWDEWSTELEESIDSLADFSLSVVRQSLREYCQEPMFLLDGGNFCVHFVGGLADKFGVETLKSGSEFQSELKRILDSLQTHDNIKNEETDVFLAKMAEFQSIN